MKQKIIILSSVFVLVGLFIGYFGYLMSQGKSVFNEVFTAKAQKSVNQAVYQSAYSSMSVGLVGDIMLDRWVGKKIDQYGVNFPFEKVKKLLSAPDISMANLECPIAVSGQAVVGKQYTFRAKPKVVQGLKNSGLDVFSLANNHILDYGQAAMLETMNFLKSGGLQYVGGGKNSSEAYQPYCFSKNGQTIAFFAVNRIVPATSWYAGKNSPGVAGIFNTQPLLKSIANVDKNDFIVVYLHWGTELKTLPDDAQKNLAKYLIDHGVDLVVGAHPHVLQGFEFYHGKLIAYSLGNFVFDNLKNDTMILNLKIRGKQIISARVIPCNINHDQPEPVLNASAQKQLYQSLQDRSFGVNINQVGIITKK